MIDFLLGVVVGAVFAPVWMSIGKAAWEWLKRNFGGE